MFQLSQFTTEQKNQFIYWAILAVVFIGAVDLTIWANFNFIKNYPVLKNDIIHQEKNQIDLLAIGAQWEKELIKQPSSDCNISDSDNNEHKEYCTFDNYLAGKIASGPFFVGENIYLEVEHSIGDIFRHYILKDGSKFYLDGYYGENEKNRNFIIQGISDLPGEINLPNSNYKLKLSNYSNYFFKDLKINKKVFNNKLGDFYLADDGCLALELPNHTAISSDFVLSFINKENGELIITLENGQKYTDEYEFTKILGCGGFCSPLNNINIVNLENNLIIAGKTDSGESFYKFKDGQDDRLRALYNDKNTLAYYTENSGESLSANKYTYQQFIDFYPLLYWKDPLGRWIEFKNKRFGTAAEMCKPAIYLYPQKKIDINVKVAPNGGFTKTIPLYNNGWQITAYPGSKIFDRISKQAYPYLYWSGIAVNYPVLNEGWVVKKEELGAFFDAKLKFMGLNSVEIKDFEEYWLGELSAKPYYQISFLFNDIVDKLAPLSFSVKPDKVFRVILVVKGLDEFKNITEQKLSVIGDRDGFTAVEWGGMLLK